MVVEVVLDGRRVNLGGEGQIVHQVLAQGLIGVALLVQNLAHIPTRPLQQVLGLGQSCGQRLDVGDKRRGAVLVVGGASDSLEGGAVSVAGRKLVRNLNEETRLGSALRVDGGGRGDVALGFDVFARLGGDGQVHGWVGKRARLRGGEEVLDEGGEGVELERGGIPAQQGLAGRGLEREGQHRPLVLHVHFDLVLILDVRNREAVSYLNLRAVLGAHADQGANDAGFWGVWVGGGVDGVIAAGGMVEYREDSLLRLELAWWFLVLKSDLDLHTWGWRLTVMGVMLLLKPGMDGAMGLARWRNSSVSIAMLKTMVGYS